MNTSVTFDSNVWECIVDDDKRKKLDKVYTKLYELIQSELISPYFFEGIVTMEGLMKNLRKDFIKNYGGNLSLIIDGYEIVSPDKIDAFEVPGYLKLNVPKALKMGFKFIRLPRIGGIGINNLDAYYALDSKYSLNERLERSINCCKFIENLDAGKAALMNMLNGGNKNYGLVANTKNDKVISEKKFSKGFSEWVDGDALAVTYGYGIDYFCTSDSALNSGSSSIFHTNNIMQLQNHFSIKIVSPHELVTALSNPS